MFIGHGQNYFVDDIAFAISTIPVVLVGILIIASLRANKRASTLANRSFNRG